MLLSGTRGAPYTCLRCQLRRAILHSRRQGEEQRTADRVRSFSSTPQPRDQQDDNPVRVPRRRNDVVYHHPLGRIVGAPGRRQRQGTQKLKIDAMKKPFEVIVMQDVREPEERRPLARNPHNGAPMTSAQIEREMAREGEEPTQDEVNESISALRPHSMMLDEAQYEELAKSLTDGFTNDQLHGFLTQSLNLGAVESDTVHLLRQEPDKLQTRYQRTQWRPGRTRIEKRLPLGAVVRKSEKTNKPKLVEQILRLAWNLSIHAEEQKVGELEMRLQHWQMRYLFDLQTAGGGQEEHSMYESVVGSPFLLQACSLRPYRPQAYLRISGRRQDAEEVARRIEEKLPEIKRLMLELDAFSPLLGTPGWPNKLANLFRKDDIDYIQNRTSTIVEQVQSNVVHIYGSSPSRRWEARRVLLALLELPSPFTFSAETLLHQRRSKMFRLPETAGGSVQLRHRKRDLTRLTLPTERKLDSTGTLTRQRNSQDSTSITKLKTQLTEQLAIATRVSASITEKTLGSRWAIDHGASSTWYAQFCRMLYGDIEQSSGSKSKKQTRPPFANQLAVVNAQTQHLESLLSFFGPRFPYDTGAAQLRAQPALIARLVPSPFGKMGVEAMKALPPVELAYHHFTHPDGKPDVRFVGAQATLRQHDVRVPLPTEATDLRFQRKEVLRAQSIKIERDGEIAAFTQHLRESLQASKHANLVGKPFVKIRLAPSLVPGGAVLEEPDDATESAESVPDQVVKRTRDVSVQYLFMSFEQTQSYAYVPLPEEKLPKSMDPELKAVLGGFGETFFLQVKEVFAGTLGGRRMEVSLAHDPALARSPSESRHDTPLASHASTEAQVESKEGAEDADTLGDPRVAPDGAQRDQEQATSKMVDIALGMARLLTKIGQGEVRPLINHLPQRRKPDDSTGDAMRQGRGTTEPTDADKGIDV